MYAQFFKAMHRWVSPFSECVSGVSVLVSLPLQFLDHEIQPTAIIEKFRCLEIASDHHNCTPKYRVTKDIIAIYKHFC